MHIERSPADIKIPAHWQLIGRNMTLRYRPAVFFPHPHLIALSFTQGKIRCAFQKHCFSFWTLFITIA